MRLDEPKVDELRRWAYGLREAGSEESVAAGRAILMLIDEIDRLLLELRRTGDPLGGVDPESNPEVDATTGDRVSSALHGRLQRALGRDYDRSRGAGSESAEEIDQSMELESGTSSAQSWIDTLRRQK